jgi:alkyl hydroperoxide reductase subunit AhpC
MKDGHGEVCPANWREDDSGRSYREVDYFAAVDGQHENGKANCTKRVRVD